MRGGFSCAAFLDGKIFTAIVSRPYEVIYACGVVLTGAVLQSSAQMDVREMHDSKDRLLG